VMLLLHFLLLLLLLLQVSEYCMQHFDILMLHVMLRIISCFCSGSYYGVSGQRDRRASRS
jgi:hypothetical protein